MDVKSDKLKKKYETSERPYEKNIKAGFDFLLKNIHPSPLLKSV